MIRDIKIQGYKKLVKRGSTVVDIDNNEYQQALARRKRDLELNNVITETKELKEKVDNLDHKLDLILKLMEKKRD